MANYPINEQTGDDVAVGRCYYHLENGHTCPRHGDVSKALRTFSLEGLLTLEREHTSRQGKLNLHSNN